MHKTLRAFRVALPYTAPIFTGYLILGVAWGVLMRSNGFSLWTIGAISLFVFAGSMQYVAVPLLAAPFSPLVMLAMTLMVNARHLFYSISFLEKYRDSGKVKPYLIFSLTDETFSVLCGVTPPDNVDQTAFAFAVSFLHHMYWFGASMLGGLFGSLIPWNTTGLDFVLTALFVVIFLDQWRSQSHHEAAVSGVACTVLCRLLFGADNFLIPSMVCILICLTLLRGRIEAHTS